MLSLSEVATALRAGNGVVIDMSDSSHARQQSEDSAGMPCLVSHAGLPLGASDLGLWHAMSVPVLAT